MKSKTKLALLSALVSCGVFASAATATFAWFTINSTVSLEYGNITVASDNTHIRVHIYDFNNRGIFDGPTLITNENRVVSNKLVISSASGYDGFSFTNKDTSGQVTTLNGDALKARVFMFGVAVECLASTVQQNLKTNINWVAATQNHSPSDALVGWTRCSIISVGNSYFNSPTSATKGLYVPDSTVNQQYLNNSSQLTAVPSSYTIVDKGSDLSLGSYTDSVWKYYRIAVWMEGTYSDAQDIARGGQIRFTLTFSAEADSGE